MRRLLPLAFLAIAGCVQTAPMPAPPPPEVSYAWVTFDANGMRESGASGMADRARAARLPSTIRCGSHPFRSWWWRLG